MHVHSTSRILGQHECMNVDLSSSLSQEICTSLTQISNQCELNRQKNSYWQQKMKPDKTIHVIQSTLISKKIVTKTVELGYWTEPTSCLKTISTQTATIHVQPIALVKDPRNVLNVPKVMSRVTKKDVKVLSSLKFSFTKAA